MRFFALAAVLLLLPSMANGALTPADFAYGMPLSFEESGAVYRFSIPREVYQKVTRDDLGDIRIFNSAKAEVPHTLRRPKKKSEILEQTEPLPFFPLYREENSGETTNLSLEIKIGADGAIIKVESNDAGDGKDQKLSGYIIDVNKHEKRIHELDISWQTKEENFITTVSVEESNDLTFWSASVPRATLARMLFSGHEINRNRILLPEKRAKYLRLSWPAGGDGVVVKKILAVYRSGEPEREWFWAALQGEYKPDDKKREISAYEYDSVARLPIDGIRLRFAERNTLVKGTFFSRPDLDAKWRYLTSGIFYDLRFDQTSLVKDTVSIGLTPDRYWRVEIEGGVSGDHGNIPMVELRWLPHELLFVARGEGPFLLAYGSARLEEEARNGGASGLLAQVMGEDEDALIKEAVLLPETVLGGPDLLVPKAPPFPWKKWMLWGVLLVGVCILAIMALSLVKGMNKKMDEKGDGP
jgi:hypothetical protein